MFLQFDKYITEKLQAVYLWIYDWTGVYVASLMALVAIIGNFAVGLTPIQILFLFLNLFILIPNYLDQDHQNYTAYNLRALEVRDYRMRLIASGFFILIGACEFVSLFTTIDYRFGNLINSICLWLYLNSFTVCIREREPKEWFKQATLATESTS